jgi:hypothetical protein
MFLYLTPGAAFIAGLTSSWIIEATDPNGDSRNFIGPMCMLYTAIPALVCGIAAMLEALRPKGLRRLLAALLRSSLLAFGPWMILWAIIHFDLLKHT